MIMNREEMIKKLLDQVHELEGIVNGMFEKMEESREALARIREESERLRLAETEPAETPEDEPVDDFASSYEIEDEDEDEEIVIEPRTETERTPGEQQTTGMGYITDLDEDSAFGCYADFLPGDGSEDDNEDDSEDNTEDDTEKDTGEFLAETISVAPPVQTVITGTQLRSNLRKSFSLNDMFRFAILFGGRNALTELLDRLDRVATPAEVDQLIDASLRKGSDEEVVAEFIEKVHAEKF